MIDNKQIHHVNALLILFFLENIAELTPLSDLFSLLVNEEVAVNKFRSFKIALDEAWKDTVTSPSVTVLRQDRYITEQGFVIPIKVFGHVHFHPNSCVILKKTSYYFVCDFARCN